MRKQRGRQRGFTLIEAVVVMVVLGILGAAVGILAGVPLRGAGDAAERARLTDAADSAIRRLERDLRNALPNSIRLSTIGSVVYLEYLEVRTAGRYRVAPSGVAGDANSCPDGNADGLADEDMLDFTAADSCFRATGAVPNLSSIVAGSDYLVVFNLGAGISGSNAWEYSGTGGNKALVSAVSNTTASEPRITFASLAFPFASPANRFHIVSGPVTWVCDPGAGSLRRMSNYPIATGQPVPPSSPGANVLVSGDLSACAFSYLATASERMGLLAMTIGLTRNGETVTLHHETAISNIP